MKKNSIWIIGVFLTQFGCSNVQRMDTTEVKEEMEGHKIRRISPARIMEQVEVLGSKITIILTKDFEKQMKDASPNRTEEICALKNMQVIDSLSKKYKLTIRLLGQPDIGSNNSLYLKEKEVLEAYADNAMQKLPLSNNIQSIDDSLFVYTAPIGVDKGVGKLCFSDDSGFAIWSIVLKKAEVIKSIGSEK
ncbi:hypothetical protein [Emticicia sp. BO119]|uniref:hypothetical protein n=1 Tax=Emticicia sp. BO119 TaxID=2757768 RepID=UPI0015F0470B|nr:hypothetical protein [Emticicia sp. BO119]MBA4851713.1 hypothetical protein [Emticicia sp. BO119]